MNLTDHAGVRLTHGKPKVNGVEIHYALGGAGEPVFLLHGVPKTMSYWRHLVPLLTPLYTVIQMWDPARWARRTSTKSCTRPSSRAAPGAILEMYRARQTDAEQNRPHYADRSPARSWPSARRPISGTPSPSSSRKWPATSAASSSPPPVTTSRWRTQPPWRGRTSTSSLAGEPDNRSVIPVAGGGPLSG